MESSHSPLNARENFDKEMAYIVAQVRDGVWNMEEAERFIASSLDTYTAELLESMAKEGEEAAEFYLPQTKGLPFISLTEFLRIIRSHIPKV